VRRAIVLCEPDADSHDIEQLTEAHGLDIVHTVYVSDGSAHAPVIAVQHALYHDAEVVVVPRLSDAAANARPWKAVTGLADLVTSTSVIECGLFGS
jgi:hypothetical protein